MTEKTCGAATKRHRTSNKIIRNTSGFGLCRFLQRRLTKVWSQLIFPSQLKLLWQVIPFHANGSYIRGGLRLGILISCHIARNIISPILSVEIYTTNPSITQLLRTSADARVPQFQRPVSLTMEQLFFQHSNVVDSIENGCGPGARLAESTCRESGQVTSSVNIITRGQQKETTDGNRKNRSIKERFTIFVKEMFKIK